MVGSFSRRRTKESLRSKCTTLQADVFLYLSCKEQVRDRYATGNFTEEQVTVMEQRVFLMKSSRMGAICNIDFKYIETAKFLAQQPTFMELKNKSRSGTPRARNGEVNQILTGRSSSKEIDRNSLKSRGMEIGADNEMNELEGGMESPRGASENDTIVPTARHLFSEYERDPVERHEVKEREREEVPLNIGSATDLLPETTGSVGGAFKHLWN